MPRALWRQTEELEARLVSVGGEKERSELEAQKQRYELHAQLTEARRRLEQLASRLLIRSHLTP